ncbi:MAG: type IV pilus assembly protein PilM [Armatimonadetes bacterium]|nr:type IV pilus assembly protein PilM [Armatimonadota bacterium]
MARGVTHVLGVDPGTQSIKVVELQQTAHGVALVRLPVILPTPEKAVDGGQVSDPNAVAAALREALRIGHFTCKKAVVSVAGDPMVIVRVTEMARLSGKDLEDAVKFEIGRHSQFGIEDLYYDYDILQPRDAPADAQKMEVLLAAAHEEVVNNTVNALLRAKLQPVGVDVQPLALSRAALQSAGLQGFDQTICCLHIGASATMIIMVRKGLTNFIRFLPQSSEAMTVAIRRAGVGDAAKAEAVKRALADVSTLVGFEGADEGSVFEVSDTSLVEAAAEEPEEATLLDIDQTLPEGVEGPPVPRPAPHAAPSAVPGMTEEERQAADALLTALEQPVADLATELRRSIDFYRRQHRNEPVDRVVLSGGGALLRGLAELLSAETGIRCEMANPFANMLLPDDSEDLKQYLAQIGPLMTVATGLALRDIIQTPVTAGGQA